MTKAQEKEVLKKISELIESTGKDSYIATAFAGCVADAEANIEDDAAYSWQDRACSTEKKWHEALKEAEIAKERAKAQDIRADEANHRAHTAEVRADHLQGEINRRDEAIIKLSDNLIEQQKQAEQQAAEIISLKAKLYDLITKEN